MPDMMMQRWYRATCFGKPTGPWRDRLREVQEDLEADSLGSRDEYGQFYITVPGGIERRSAWVEFEEAYRPLGASHASCAPDHTPDDRECLVAA